MTRIQSSVGLATGIPIQETVNQLMAVAARPKNLLTERTRLLQSERLAIDQLSSLLVAFQFEVNQLGSESVYSTRSVTSSNTSALTAVAGSSSPAVASYQFTPVQTAAAQQFLSQAFPADEELGAGSITFRTGGFVDKSISLEELNGGAGVRRGKIRITDRNGDSAIVDLSYVRTVDDVLAAINSQSDANVTAIAVGDRFKLIDHTGGAGNLIVQEVAGGFTAIDLGLAGINSAANEATGGDVFSLHAQTKLSALNDGTGVQLRSGNDLAISLADGSTLNVDLGEAQTLGAALTALNAVSPTKLSAAIAADGNRIELTDLTTGTGEFAVANVGSGTAADDLGLTAAADDDTISGARLASGLKDTLVSSLNGGQGLGTLGEVDITNRAGASFTVNLAGADTLGDIIAAFNAQSTNVTAAVNSARNGILLTDTSGGTSSNFIVADGDANDTATALGLVASTTETSVNGGELNRRQIAHATLLSSLNGGQGIKVGDFLITDSSGALGAVDLNATGNVATTVGDVIDRMNALSIGVEARINDRGDGILLIDTANGDGMLTVAEVTGGTTAKDLRLLGPAVEAEIDNQTRQVIDGTAAATVTIDADDTLSDIVATINGLARGVTASILNDGTGQRLALSVDASGADAAIVLDATDSALVFQEVTAARDAVLLYGAGDSPASGVLIRSSTNTFTDVVAGLNVTVSSGTREAVIVNVANSTTSVVTAVQEFVGAYNSLRDTIDKTTVFDAETLTTGILFGRNEPLRIESDLTRILTSRFFGVGQFQSLESLGLSLTDEGKLEFDTAEFNDAVAADPAAIQTLFAHETLGVAAKLNVAIEQLAGEDNSMLASRGETLNNTIEANNARIATMDERLARQRDRLLAEFARIESVVADLRQNLTALSSIQVLPTLVNTRTR